MYRYIRCFFLWYLHSCRLQRGFTAVCVKPAHVPSLVGRHTRQTRHTEQGFQPVLYLEACTPGLVMRKLYSTGQGQVLEDRTHKYEDMLGADREEFADKNKAKLFSTA